MNEVRSLRFTQALLFILIFLVGIAVLPDSTSSAQTGGADPLILEGKVLLKTGLDGNDLEKIMQARALFERALADPDREALAHYYAALADYRLANLLIQSDRKRTRTYLNDSIDHLKEATQLDGEFAEAYALLSGVYGQKIGLNPLQSIVLGPRSGKAIERAVALTPDNPRVVLLQAVGLYYTPKAFGGDREKAIAGFQRAAGLFEQEVVTDTIQPDWGNDEIYAWIGIACKDAGEIEKAREAYEKALEINPECGWVKYVLLPQLPPL